LLAKAVDQPTCSVTGIPPSRASPLPHWGMRRPLLRCTPAIPTAQPNAKLHTDQKCGSGLARESGGSANIFGDWHTAFAGKPAPTLGDASSIAAAQVPAIPTAQPNAKLHTDQKCGSGLARESSGSANMFGDWHTAFAGKPAPTLGGCVVRSCGATRQFQPHSQTRSFTPIKNVGAGLLAIAVDQPTCSVTDIPPSRASPLPHWDASSIAAAQGPAISTAQPNAKLHTDQKCGSGLARESSGSANMFGGWHTAFAGKPAPTLGDASPALAVQPGNSNRAAKREASHRSKMWERACPRRRWIRAG